MPRASVGLHDHGGQGCLHVPRLQQHGRMPGLYPASIQPLRQRTRLQTDAGQGQSQPGQEGGERLRLTRHLRLADDLSGGVDHADAAEVQRHVNPGMVLQGCPS